MKDVMFVFGTRPETIKLAPVIKAAQRSSGLEPTICVTGQHREMLDQMLHVFDLSPYYDLEIMEENQSLAGMSSRLIEELDKVIEIEKPDVTVVQGDTTTSFIGGLISFYRRIPLAHVEAGLRSGDKNDPFPEEMNRALTDRISDIFFAPTEENKVNLKREGVESERICVTGNTVIDALFFIKDLIERGKMEIDLPMKKEEIEGREVVLITAHRRESFGRGLENICRAVRELALSYPSYLFVYPVHLNPNVRSKVDAILGEAENIVLTDPLCYPEFVWLMEKAQLILTDSGGIQEEAPSLDTPVLVMRETTERNEALKAGTVELVGVDSRRIQERAKEFISNEDLREEMRTRENPYGDGQAAGRIVDELVILI